MPVKLTGAPKLPVGRPRLPKGKKLRKHDITMSDEEWEYARSHAEGASAAIRKALALLRSREASVREVAYLEAQQ